MLEKFNKKFNKLDIQKQILIIICICSIIGTGLGNTENTRVAISVILSFLTVIYKYNFDFKNNK